MHPLLANLPEEQRNKLVARNQPPWLEPMLATPASPQSMTGDWIFEQKFDGERCLVFRSRKRVRLLSRNRKVLNDTYPELVEALETITEGEFIADGEIVAFEGEIQNFSRLQERMQIRDREMARRSEVTVYLYLFDLVYLEGFDLSALDLRTRKNLLKALIPFRDPLRYTGHQEDGLEYYREACRRGLEGIIAKRGSGRYLHRRSTDWLKFKCLTRQEFVIGGYTDPGGSRPGFGALLLGYYDGTTLLYAGKVGIGFSDKTLRDLGARLVRIEQNPSPFADKEKPERGEHFVTPTLVCEIIFTEWTPDGKLRHPKYIGLRDDKVPEEVVRENPRA